MENRTETLSFVTRQEKLAIITEVRSNIHGFIGEIQYTRQAQKWWFRLPCQPWQGLTSTERRAAALDRLRTAHAASVDAHGASR